METDEHSFYFKHLSNIVIFWNESFLENLYLSISVLKFKVQCIKFHGPLAQDGAPKLWQPVSLDSKTEAAGLYINFFFLNLISNKIKKAHTIDKYVYNSKTCTQNTIFDGLVFFLATQERFKWFIGASLQNHLHIYIYSTNNI